MLESFFFQYWTDNVHCGWMFAFIGQFVPPSFNFPLGYQGLQSYCIHGAKESRGKRRARVIRGFICNYQTNIRTLWIILLFKCCILINSSSIQYWNISVNRPYHLNFPDIVLSSSGWKISIKRHNFTGKNECKYIFLQISIKFRPITPTNSTKLRAQQNNDIHSIHNVVSTWWYQMQYSAHWINMQL